MKKIVALLLALLLPVLPAWAESAEEPSAMEAFAGYWELAGVLEEGELVEPAAFETFTVKCKVAFEDDRWNANFQCKIDGESKIVNGWWQEGDQEYEVGFELKGDDGVVQGVAYAAWKVEEDGNLYLTYETPDETIVIVFAPAEAPQVSDVVGRWVNVRTYDSGEYFDYAAFGIDFVLYEDGVAELQLEGEYFGSGEWTQDGDTILMDIEGRPFELRINGDTLEMVEDETFAHVYEKQ